jgi:hypothetical protein
MSVKAARDYFADVMATLNFHEHEDAFNDANIPATVLDKSFHVRIDSGAAIKTGHRMEEIEVKAEIKFFIKGYKSTLEAMNESLTEMDGVIKEAMTTIRRTTNPYGVRNVLFSDFSIDPIDDSNDNSVKATVRFRAMVLYILT